MKDKLRKLGFMAAGALALAATPASAGIILPLNEISSPSIGTGTLGYVDVTQVDPNQIDVTVTLAANTKFVYTGGPHHAFAFNLNAVGPYSVAINNLPPGEFGVTSPNIENTPFGNFTDGVDCPKCGPGASNAKPGPLSLSIYSIDGLDPSDLFANANGYFFSADVIGPNGGTGNIATKQYTPYISITSVNTDTPPVFIGTTNTNNLTLLGLSLLGLAIRRKNERSANNRPSATAQLAYT